MFNFLKKIWKNKELRNNLFIIAGILVVFRILAHIPIPGADLEALRNFFNRNQIFGLLNIFSGGAMSQFSVVTLGVAPYINASIIIQLLTVVVPQLEALQKEGERGQFKINQYTRYLTVPLAFVESYGFIILLSKSSTGQPIISNLSAFFILGAMITMTAGSVFLMWLGEIISEKNIGNGISLIIFTGIIAKIPSVVQQTFAFLDPGKILTVIAFAAAAAVIIFAIVIITEGQRNIPVMYARRVRGTKMYGSSSTYLPLRVTQAGVVPIIFAMSLMLFPGIIAKFLLQAKSSLVVNGARFVETLFNNQVFFSSFYFILVVAFTYFYTSIIFKPDQVAENIQKQGGFIPGLRPGRQTAEYLEKVVLRITLPGAMFLGVIAILPFIMQQLTGVQTLVIGGTGLLIVVSVAIELVKQIEAQLIMKNYENY